ncbi:flagellar hook assembly protein FlgD [Lentibacillus persicus]|nr:flagellar hook assembly protein FlgD [Lentibacillus persicus]
MTSIDSSLYLQNRPLERVPSPELGKDEFLQILMTQLQNQDPTSPMDESQFISQMSTFSQLEQTMNMANSIEKLVQQQNVSPILQYSHMIGKEVTYNTYDEETGEVVDSISGVIKAVSQDEGRAVMMLENETKIYADSIVELRNPEAGSDSEGSD